MDQNFDLPNFPKLNILIIFTLRGPGGKNGKNFDPPNFPKFEANRVEALPYRLETCRAGPRPISLCVEKTKNFDQIQEPQLWWQKWSEILITPISLNLKPLE